MRLIDFALTGIVAAAALTSGPAQTSPTFTPGGGPEVNFVGSDVSFTNVQANQTLTCEQVDFAGAVLDPGTARPYGDNAGVLDDLTADGCTNPLGGTTSVTLTGTPTVSINGDPTGTRWPAQLADVSASISVAGCSFTVEGTVDGVFDTATQVVTPTSNTLTIVDEPIGYLCPIPGLAKDQTFEVEGYWTNVPPAGSGPLTMANP